VLVRLPLHVPARSEHQSRAPPSRDAAWGVGVYRAYLIRTSHTVNLDVDLNYRTTSSSDAALGVGVQGSLDWLTRLEGHTIEGLTRLASLLDKKAYSIRRSHNSRSQ